MTEQITTGEMAADGYEYPPVCPIDACDGNVPAMSWRDGSWRCDECGKVLICWTRETIQRPKGKHASWPFAFYSQQPVKRETK